MKNDVVSKYFCRWCHKTALFPPSPLMSKLFGPSSFLVVYLAPKILGVAILGPNTCREKRYVPLFNLTLSLQSCEQDPLLIAPIHVQMKMSAHSDGFIHIHMKCRARSWSLSIVQTISFGHRPKHQLHIILCVEYHSIYVLFLK